MNRLLLFDALALRFREVHFEKDPRCPVCGPEPTVRALIDYEEFCGLRNPGTPPAIPEISAKELAGALGRVILIDVREPHEAEIARIPGSRLIPLGEFQERLGEIDRNSDVVIHCRSGQRSAKAVRWLLQSGHERVKNLRGGILAWSDEVDPSVAKY